MEQQNIYQQRINLVTDHIRHNLTGDLSLAALADVAGFSPFHFHRVFKAMTGETLNQFVTRLRLERAAVLLKGAPGMRITEAAHACGFTSVAVFSRAFKKRYGLRASDWDRQTALHDSKISQKFEGFTDYTGPMLSRIAERGEFTVQIRSLPAQRLAYLRVTDSYAPDRIVAAYERFVDWYAAQGGQPRQATLYGMSQDDPDITPLPLCRYDWCFPLPDGWTVNGEISERLFPACTLAAIHCRGDIYLVDRAWRYLFGYWLPRSGFQPDNLPAMEIYRRQPLELGWETYDLDCAVPVVKL